MRTQAPFRHLLIGGLLGLSAGVASLAAPAMACSLEATADLSGAFAVDHRGSIAVAIATRNAIDAGHIAEIPKEASARLAQLKLVQLRAISHVRKAAFRPRKNAGPPVAVLLTQSGAWIRFNDPRFGAVYHANPATESETALLVPDTVYDALLDGRMSVESATELGLIRVYGTEDEGLAIASFSSVLDVSG